MYLLITCIRPPPLCLVTTIRLWKRKENNYNSRLPSHSPFLLLLSFRPSFFSFLFFFFTSFLLSLFFLQVRAFFHNAIYHTSSKLVQSKNNCCNIVSNTGIMFDQMGNMTGQCICSRKVAVHIEHAKILALMYMSNDYTRWVHLIIHLYITVIIFYYLLLWS